MIYILYEAWEIKKKLINILICIKKILQYYSASGTEDAVRVYAEAATRSETDELAYKVSLLVYNEAGGVGKPPMMP